jgi:hypothetical protein
MINSRFAGLMNALAPVNLQQVTKESPWNTGMKESTWLKQMNSVREDMVIARSLNDAIGIGKKRLRVGNPEAERIAKDARNKYAMRQVDLAVPHAYANENALAEALNIKTPTGLYNQGEGFQATDLEMMIGDIQKLVDVQTHFNPDRFNLGVLQGLSGQDVMTAWRNAAGNDTLLTMVSKLSKTQRDPNRSRDKLMQSRKVGDAGLILPSKVKDMMITGTLNQNAKRNLGDVPARKGTYNYTPLSDVDMFDMDAVRPELLKQSKNQLIKADIVPERRSAEQGRFTLGIPMEKLRAMGGVTTDYLDDETIRLLTGQ